MRAEEKVYEALRTSSALVALVGDRIDMGDRPQSQDMPNVVYERSATQPENNLSGDSGFAFVPVNVEVESESREEAYEIGRLIRKALRTLASFQDGRGDTDRERDPVRYYYTQTFQVSEREDLS